MSKQIVITVINENGKQPLRLLHASGRAVLHTMRECGMALPALCDGVGKCGRCRVRFTAGAPLPTQTERAMLEPELLRQGYRLACMARPVKDCVIECAFVQEPIVEVVTESRLPAWQHEHACAEETGAEQPGERACKEENMSDPACIKNTIVAADIGTTTIAMQLLDAASGAVEETYTCMNPQRSYGVDVISRIKAAAEGADVSLRVLVEDALQNGMKYFEACIEKRNRERNQVKQYAFLKPELLCIACNTVMGHLFLGYDTSGLGKSPFQPVQLGIVETGWKGIRTIVLPGISAFVGGDIVSGLYACGLNAESCTEPWLFMDLGTNAEMVMGAGGRVVCTAAAAGPAFEGRGEDGATGTDRICAVARLLEQELVDETGLLEEPYFSKGIEVELQDGKNLQRKTVCITQEDIRQLQMAKAAVRAGIHFLMQKLGIETFGQIRKVYVAGGFGFYLDMDAAVRIGLIPAAHEWLEEAVTETERVYPVAVGNTALAGAGQLGRRLAQDGSLDEIKGKEKITEVFNLAEEAFFEQVYVGYMNFPAK